MNVIVLYERSQEVVDAFVRIGHNAISVDIKQSYGIHRSRYMTANIDRYLAIRRFMKVVDSRMIIGREELRDLVDLGDLEELRDLVDLVDLEDLEELRDLVDLGDLEELSNLVDLADIVEPLASWTAVNRSSDVRSKTFHGVAKAMADQWGLFDEKS